MSYAKAYVPIRTSSHWERRRHDCLYCGFHGVVQQKIVEYTCAAPAWEIKRGVDPRDWRSTEWPWRAKHRPTGAQALAHGQAELSRLLGRLQQETLYCRGCQAGVIFWLTARSTLQQECGCQNCAPRAWEHIAIARCIHCSAALAFDERTFAVDSRAHTRQVHGGHLYGDPEHYTGDGTLRREYWEKHFVFEPPF